MKRCFLRELTQLIGGKGGEMTFFLKFNQSFQINMRISYTRVRSISMTTSWRRTTISLRFPTSTTGSSARESSSSLPGDSPRSLRTRRIPRRWSSTLLRSTSPATCAAELTYPSPTESLNCYCKSYFSLSLLWSFLSVSLRLSFQ